MAASEETKKSIIWVFMTPTECVIFRGLPDWIKFEACIGNMKIVLPEEFQQSYFNPAIFALNRCLNEKNFNETYYPYISFQCEGRIMTFQGFQENNIT